MAEEKHAGQLRRGTRDTRDLGGGFVVKPVGIQGAERMVNHDNGSNDK